MFNLVLFGGAVRAADDAFPNPMCLPSPQEGAIGFPSRDPNLDALPGFQDSPPGYGEVLFWWWTGEPLDKERLVWRIEQLHEKGSSGMQVNYEPCTSFPWYNRGNDLYPIEPQENNHIHYHMCPSDLGRATVRTWPIGVNTDD